MKGNADKEKDTKKKSFFAKVFDKLDKKMGEKAKSISCCCKPGNRGGDSCCS